MSGADERGLLEVQTCWSQPIDNLTIKPPIAICLAVVPLARSRFCIIEAVGKCIVAGYDAAMLPRPMVLAAVYILKGALSVKLSIQKLSGVDGAAWKDVSATPFHSAVFAVALISQKALSCRASFCLRHCRNRAAVGQP